jgi:hypothetical protein
MMFKKRSDDLIIPMDRCYSLTFSIGWPQQ